MKNLFWHAYDVKYENGRYRPTRFTDKQIVSLGTINPMYGNIGRCSAGISLKFYTDAKEISFSYQYTILYTRMGGFDIYENGVMIANEELPAESGEGKFTYQKEADGETLIEIFLPNNAEMELWDLSLGNYRAAEKTADKLVCYYGDSITQSAYTKTPSLCFATLASDIAGTDYINRGVGSLYYDVRALDEEDTLKPDIIFVELGANDMVKRVDGKVIITDSKVQYNTKEDIPVLIGNAKTYLEKMKEIYKDSKIYVVSMLWHCADKPADRQETRYAYVAELEKLADSLGLTFIDGETMSAHYEGCHYEGDHIHLNALGGASAALSFAKYIG